jgi:hypothetical protein
MQSENTNELVAALTKAQTVMKPAVFNRVNPHFKNRYADLTAVMEAARPLAANGIAVTHVPEIREDGFFVLVTTLHHTSGQWISGVWPLPMGVKPQEMASAVTYAKRYSLCAIAAIVADEDDDAEGARTNGQVSSVPKGKTRAERETSDDPRYQVDENGETVANIPFGDPSIERLSAQDARADADKASRELIAHDSIKTLMPWGKIMGNRVDSWPDHWSVKFRNRFEEHKNYLMAKEHQAA